MLEPRKPITIHDVQQAFDVQSACNPSGVLHSFLDMYLRLRDEVGWDAAARHPLTVLWVDKIHDMFGRPTCAAYSRAYTACQDILRDKPVADASVSQLLQATDCFAIHEEETGS